MTLGKSFIDAFSSNIQQDKQQINPVQPQPLSNKTGINKKKTTALQQQIVGNISNSGMMNGALQ